MARLLRITARASCARRASLLAATLAMNCKRQRQAVQGCIRCAAKGELASSSQACACRPAAHQAMHCVHTRMPAPSTQHLQSYARTAALSPSHLVVLLLAQLVFRLLEGDGAAGGGVGSKQILRTEAPLLLQLHVGCTKASSRQ